MIKPSKSALRTDNGPMNGLMLSIEDKGLLEPIIVRPAGDGFEVVAGMRRFEACKKLGWRRIPAHVVELTDREAFEVSLLENIQRETLNPIEEARAFRNYVEEFGYGGGDGTRAEDREESGVRESANRSAVPPATGTGPDYAAPNNSERCAGADPPERRGC